LVMEEKTSQTDFQSLEPLDNALADQEAIEIIDNVPPAEEVIAENEDQKSSEELSTKEEAVTLNEPLQIAESVVIEQDVGEVFYSDEEETNDEIESPVVQEEVVAEALAFEEDDKVSDEIVLESIAATSPLKSKKREKIDAEPQKKELNNNAQARGQAAFARSASATPVLTGKVTDDYGETLPGVNVVIKGTTIGTTTDLDGTYRLSKFDGMTLVFSFVGFESQEVEVGNRNTIDVAMGGATELQEVVVTAQGVQEDNNTFSPARPEGGRNAYKVYLEANLKYPTAALENDIEGTVTVEVRISPSGAIAETMIKKSLGYGCDEEAIRLILDGPNWNAAKKGNNRIEDSVKVKVKFKLEK